MAKLIEVDEIPKKQPRLSAVDKPLTFAERNIAPVLQDLYGATGLSSQPVQDFATGASGLMRGAANLVSQGAGNQMFPPNSSGSGYETAGELLDPVAMLAGEAGFRAGAKAIPYIKGGANRLMQSALKPVIADLKSGRAATAANTLLEQGINATAGGVNKLKTKIGEINQQIAEQIASSPAMISKTQAMNPLMQTSRDFSRQVSPASDLNAINNVAVDFINHPLLPSDKIPVGLAQEMKQGTYSILNKKYGQVGSAETEAQKALARGLKDEIAAAVPAIKPLNELDTKLINTLKVTERRALMDANKNPMGLALLAQNPATWAAFMADKSALFKSLAARMINATAPIAPISGGVAAYGATQGLLNPD